MVWLLFHNIPFNTETMLSLCLVSNDLETDKFNLVCFLISSRKWIFLNKLSKQECKGCASEKSSCFHTYRCTYTCMNICIYTYAYKIYVGPLLVTGHSSLWIKERTAGFPSDFVLLALFELLYAFWKRSIQKNTPFIKLCPQTDILSITPNFTVVLEEYQHHLQLSLSRPIY